MRGFAITAYNFNNIFLNGHNYIVTVFHIFVIAR